MESMDILSVLFRWLHVAAGILWIGLLYWFNFINIPFVGTMDGDTKKKVLPEMLPRALYWFRWGAAYTWATGVLLILLVFYQGGLMFDQGVEQWTAGSWVMIAVTFLMFPLYDVIAKSGLGKDIKVFGAIGFILIAVILYAMSAVGKFSDRAALIHMGAMFGTIMAANVWMRIYQAQKKIIPAFKEGVAPDAALAAMSSQRSRHNVYLSIPLVWTMINMHTVAVFSTNSKYYLLAALVLGWIVVSMAFDKSAKVKGL
jgi:uncharacterized membrane protein